MLLLQRLRVFLTKFNKKKVETRQSLLAKDGLQVSSKALQIHCIKVSGEAASADIEATRAFNADFENIFEDNDFLPGLVFLTWMRQGCIGKSYSQELIYRGKN